MGFIIGPQVYMIGLIAIAKYITIQLIIISYFNQYYKYLDFIITKRLLIIICVEKEKKTRMSYFDVDSLFSLRNRTGLY